MNAMRGLDLFIHAVRMVLGNMAMTLRVGGVLLVVLVILLQIIGPAYFAPPVAAGMGMNPMSGGSLATFALGLLRIVSTVRLPLV